MKHEYKKHEKTLYAPTENPHVLIVPKLKYFCIKGQGNPNQEDFAKRVEALYTLAYTLKMLPKKGIHPEGYFEYTVYPLEGLWDLSDVGRKKNQLDKNELVYTIMIRQPDFVSHELAEKVIEMAIAQKKNPLLQEASFEEIEDGLSIQVLHCGSYDDEAFSFAKMKAYIDEHQYVIKTLVHREIYLSDARKVEANKLKTILRYQLIDPQKD